MRQFTRRTLLALALPALIAVPGDARAAEFKPAVVYDTGSKFDKSFNESVWNGVQRFTRETGIKVQEFQITGEAQREQAMRRPAIRHHRRLLARSAQPAPVRLQGA